MLEDRIIVENVSKKFGKETVLDHVSLTVKATALYALLAAGD